MVNLKYNIYNCWKAFSALFFVMMILLGIDSQFAHVDVPVAAIIDEYPNLFPKKYAKVIFLNIIYKISN